MIIGKYCNESICFTSLATFFVSFTKKSNRNKILGLQVIDNILVGNDSFVFAVHISLHCVIDETTRPVTWQGYSVQTLSFIKQ